MRSLGVQLGALAAVAAAACTGAIGDAPGNQGQQPANSDIAGNTNGATNGGVNGNSGNGNSPIDASAPADPQAAGPAVLQHLTQFEYLNTVQALLGDTSLTASQVPAEAPISGFATGFPVPGLVDLTTATAYQAAAEQLAKNALGNINTILPCAASATSTASQSSCLTTFFNTFGLQAYRRPLTSTEISGLTTLYQSGMSTLNLGFSGSIDLLIEEMLQSPGFLYHWEIGPTPSVYVNDGTTQVLQLDGYAMASRLSYFLWGSMPDSTLLAAAAGNQLATDAQVTAQVTRMLADPKAQASVANFFVQWLQINNLGGVPKDSTVYSNWSTTLATEATTEFTNLVTNVVFNSTGKLPELFTTTSTQINGDLAKIYGVSGITGTQFQTATLPAGQRSGILTTVAWLAVNGDPDTDNPVYRGHSIATQFLCIPIGAPPANVPPPASAATGGTTRSRFDAHAQQGCAVASCQSVNGAIQVSSLLAQSPAVQGCFTTEAFWYALGRAPVEADAYSVQTAQNAFTTSELSVKSLLSAVADSRTFRFRTPSPGEVLP
jgi:hypothetical protein